MEATDAPIARFRRAVEAMDPAALTQVFADHPEVGEVVDEPWFSFDSPALVYAVGRRNRQVVAVLLDHGADPGAKSSWAAGGYTALHNLIDGPGPTDHEFAEYLIGRGAPVDLHAAAGLGRFDDVRRFLDEAPDRVSEAGPDGATPLHLAVNEDMAALLLARGAEIDKRCVDHRSTAAQWSVQGREGVTRYLVDRGARPDLFMAAVLDDVAMAERVLEAEPEAIDVRLLPGMSLEHLGGGDKYVWALDFADTPLEVARRRGNQEVYTWLLSRSSPQACLIQASRRGDVAAIRHITSEHPTALDALDDDVACDLLCGAEEAVGVLLSLGVDPNVRDESSGATPLHHACWRGELGNVKALLSHGADPAARDRAYQATPLGWANENGQEAVMDHLVEHTELDLVDAAWMGDAARVAAILEADPTTVDGLDGGKVSPLRGAAFMGHTEVVRLLLAGGAKTDTPHPGNGRTALDMAVAQGHDAVADLLRAAPRSHGQA